MIQVSERALSELKEQGMKKLVLDIRNNGGGLLDQAIEVADQFVPAGTKIVETRGRIPSSFSIRGFSRQSPRTLTCNPR